jgi:hypothetical protein
LQAAYNSMFSSSKTVSSVTQVIPMSTLLGLN